MSRQERRQFLMRELVQAEHFLSTTAGHPLMEPQFKNRVERIRAELAKLPVSGAAAQTVLFFTGPSVQGSRAIDAELVAESLGPFLEMVKIQYVATKHGSVGERGPLRDENEARLMLTGTPRGSFGLELSAPETDDLFPNELLSEVLVRITRLLEGASRSDEDFLLALDDIAERTLAKAPAFFDVLTKFGADLTMQTGDIRFALSQNDIARASQRVHASKSSEEDIKLAGVFRGAVLDRWRFDFRSEDGTVLSGRIDPGRSEEDVSAWLQLANEKCVALIRQVTRIAPSGATRNTHVLVDLQPA